VPMAVQAVKAGAMDFIQKPFRDQVLLDKVQHALEEHGRRHQASADHEEIVRRIESLSPREREVLEKVVEGRANKVIAADLGISQRTVEIHRARVMAKMQANSVSHLVQMVIRAEL